jgi:FkbM family methyltransferase
MLNVACVCWGSAYSKQYVEILYDMVRRNLAEGTAGKFICFTDDPSGFSSGIETRQLPAGPVGWFNKLALFSKDAFPSGERVLYVDLSTVITGSLDQIAAYRGKFAILRDYFRPDGWQSSVMAWEAGTLTHIWDNYAAAGCPDVPGGDQTWIEQQLDSADLWQQLFPGSFRSYKKSCVSGIPSGTAVVNFHGRPKPHECLGGWVPEVWKVGGGSVAELVLIPNVPPDELFGNVRSAMKRNAPWLQQRDAHDDTAIIVGGGPSLVDNVPMLANIASGATVFATNNTDAYLRSKGIVPDHHVMMDARPQMMDMVNGTPALYASQCHPAVLSEAEDLTLWHALTDGIEDIVPNGVLVGGGTTVGLKTMAIAFAMGYRKMLLFGFDSSYRESHHAYAQPLNDGERVLDVLCGGAKFRAAPWMVQQAEDFRRLATQLTQMGCEISIYGDGLLPHMAKTMNDDIVEVDGLYWPSRDVETRLSVEHTFDDLGQFIKLCPQRSVAVQAGGNVGVWPKELSKHFDTVVTFEPDALNWRCLDINVTEANVTKLNAALGSDHGVAGVHHDELNCGASYLVEGGSVPVIPLDSLGLTACDFFQLDVEGYEFEALKGAEETIKRHSPVIVLEQKGLGTRFGTTDQDVAAWLAERGYTPAMRIHRDTVYTRTA